MQELLCPSPVCVLFVVGVLGLCQSHVCKQAICCWVGVGQAHSFFSELPLLDTCKQGDM
jgi:hypothetical protein